MPRATFFCVDIECSGPVPGLYDMLSLGAVPVRFSSKQEFEVGDTLYLEIIPTAPRIDEGAMAVNGLNIETLRREGMPLERALKQLSAWVVEQTVPGTKPVFVGHNAPFDWSFVNYCFVEQNLENPFGYKALDTKALAMGILGVHWFDSNKELLERELKLPAPEAAQVHRADYDAWYQALILIELLKRRPSCVDL